MSKKILLIVDDDPQIVALLASRLKAAGFAIAVALDPVMAMNLIGQNKPDLILLDIRMPAGGGEHLYETIRRSAKTMLVPVIFMTAYPENEFLQKVKGSANTDLIFKPFESGVLLEKIKKLVGEE